MSPFPSRRGPNSGSLFFTWPGGKCNRGRMSRGVGDQAPAGFGPLCTVDGNDSLRLECAQLAIRFIPPRETMYRVFLSWVVWLMLEMLWLNTAAALLLVHAPLPQSFGPTFTFVQSQADDSDGLCKNTTSVSSELVLQCEQQSKQVYPLVRVATLSSLTQQRGERRWLRPAPVPPPVHFFFPRKLSPPSAQDEPFLS